MESNVTTNKMTTIEVTELAADYIQTYRNGDGATKQKAALCDIFRDIIFDGAMNDHKISDYDWSILQALCDFNDLISEISKHDQPGAR